MKAILAAECNQIDMIGRLHLDLLFQNRYLLNGVEIRRGGGEDTIFEAKAKDSERVRGQGPSCREAKDRKA